MSVRRSAVRRHAMQLFAALAAVLPPALYVLGDLVELPGANFAITLFASSLAWLLLGWLVYRALADYPHPRFGGANVVTSVRAFLTLLLAACVPWIDGVEPGSKIETLWVLSSIAAVALLLDGLDGKLARDSGLSSSFGARYDMETDALLGLVITLLVWRSGELGPWVLGLGVLRYLFLLAAVVLPALQAELFPSFRRKLVCVVQVGVLSVLLTPVVEPALSTWLAGLALLLLVGSFLRDVLWLLGNADASVPSMASQDSDNS